MFFLENQQTSKSCFEYSNQMKVNLLAQNTTILF